MPLTFTQLIQKVITDESYASQLAQMLQDAATDRPARTSSAAWQDLLNEFALTPEEMTALGFDSEDATAMVACTIPTRLFLTAFAQFAPAPAGGGGAALMAGSSKKAGKKRKSKSKKTSQKKAPAKRKKMKRSR